MKRIGEIVTAFLGITVVFATAAVATAQTAPVTTKTEVKTVDILYDTKTTYDDNLRIGTTEIRQEGANGSKTITYNVKYKGNTEIDREKIEEKVIKEAVDKQVVVGTKQYYKCSNGTEYETTAERDECENRIRWEEQKNKSLQECYADSSKTNCWYDEYPGTYLHWTWVSYTNNYTYNNNGYRTGAICRDGWHSYATGRGACSHHGGVDYWLY